MRLEKPYIIARNYCENAPGVSDTEYYRGASKRPPWMSMKSEAHKYSEYEDAKAAAIILMETNSGIAVFDLNKPHHPIFVGDDDED